MWKTDWSKGRGISGRTRHIGDAVENSEDFMKKYLWLLVPVFILSMSPPAVAVSNESSCIKCHTDEAAFKSQFIPFKIKAEEGEG